MYLHPLLAEHYIAARRAKLEGAAANHRLIQSAGRAPRRIPWRRLVGRPVPAEGLPRSHAAVA